MGSDFMGMRRLVSTGLTIGLSNRIGDRGLVVVDWSLQALILWHSSLGGFVSHGVGASLVGIVSGMPFIATPMNLDQPWNAKLPVECEELNATMIQKGDEDVDAAVEKLVELARESNPMKVFQIVVDPFVLFLDFEHENREQVE
ncbi:UDP-glucuronosyl/UDP-glucosyltransferase [Dillenia turbinata]|uniref:UDP-glucuronosyl/UDP-glucosyltransferase n=1 Tax=Dillenia turbinata TaxID=194707 RepID=A0AAN8V380_9MAGN